MAKLKKSERQSLNVWKEQTFGHDRGQTWVGLRPAVFNSVRRDRKARRRESRILCREFSE